jgi:hypothetical protein
MTSRATTSDYSARTTMPGLVDDLVFVSYDHDDRERVAALVQRFKRRGWNVFWDRETRIGEKWRVVIEDRLDHARCVVVIWSRRSVDSEWVRAEASRAADLGVLKAARLDRVRPPLPFGEYQTADLVGWHGGRNAELDRLVRDIRHVLASGLAQGSRPTLRWSRDRSRLGVRAARHFASRIRSQTAMFQASPEATAALRLALKGVADTYAAVNTAVDAFLTPPASRALNLPHYRSLATGRLKTEIEANRAHCTHLAQAYIESGGLRDTLPSSIEPAILDELDSIFFELGTADEDLFAAMIAVGDGLETESGVVVNMLLAGEEKAAWKRIGDAERVLRPLVRDINRGMADLNRLAGTLGLDLRG